MPDTLQDNAPYTLATEPVPVSRPGTGLPESDIYHSDIPEIPCDRWSLLGIAGNLLVLLIAGMVVLSMSSRILLLPQVEAPVTATLERVEVYERSANAVYWNVVSVYNQNGRRYTNLDYKYIGTAKETESIKKPAPGDHVSVPAFADRAVDSDWLPSYAGLWIFIERSPLFSLWMITLILHALWTSYVALVQPAAAGLSHRAEPGRMVWVRLKWGEGMLRFKWWYFLVYILLESILGIVWGAYILNFFTMMAIGVLVMQRLLLGRYWSTDITADLTAGTVKVPLVSTSPSLFSVYTDAEALAERKYQVVSLADIEAFGVAFYRWPGKDNNLDLSATSCHMELRLRFVSGEEIPLSVYNNNGYGVMGRLGVQILARWLNDQLGLKQPPNLVPGRQRGWLAGTLIPAQRSECTQPEGTLSRAAPGTSYN